MSTPPKRPRKPSIKDEPINVDELAGMSNMEGMLSFLDTRPEEYAKLFAASPSLPEVIEETGSKSPDPDSNLVPDRRLPPDSNVLPDSNLHSGSNLLPDTSLLPNAKVPSGSSLHPVSIVLPGIKVPPGINLPPGCNLPSGSNLPQADEQPFLPSSSRSGSNLYTPPVEGDDFESDSNLLPDSSLPPGTNLRPPSGRPIGAGELRTANGRIVRIRLARSVQDAHSTGEHLLLQIMWKRGIAETPDTRLLQAGLAELARWTGNHKTRCRAHLRSLLEKLALEEAKTFNSAAGREGARTYRIYSFNAILERRRRANLTHVIRTGAVVFVDPLTGDRLLPDSNLQPDSTLPSAGNLPPDSNLQPEPGSNLTAEPGSNLQPYYNNREETSKTTTSAPPLVANAVMNVMGFVDDEALKTLIKKCRDSTPDATDEEIADLAAMTARRIIRLRNIENQVGLLISQTANCFRGEPFAIYRREREENERRFQTLMQEEQGREE